MKSEYWATLDAKSIGKEIERRVTDYYEYARRRGRLRLWRDVHRQYYAGYYSSGVLQDVGMANEKKLLNTNNFKAILHRLKAIISSQRPAFNARSSNGDYKSYSETVIANALIQYYLKEQHLELFEQQALEFALNYGEGWLALEWDEGQGKKLAVVPVDGEVSEDGEQQEKVITEGDVSCCVLTPNNVIRDCTMKKGTDHQWFILRRWFNKYDLVAKYTGFEKEILAHSYLPDDYIDTLIDRYTTWDKGVIESDLVPVYTLYHDRTPACPDGLQVTMLDASTVIFYGPLPYKRMPIYCVAPEWQVEDIFGYTLSFDMLQLNKVVNVLYSIITTNINAAGGSKMLIPKESNINVEEITSDLAFLKYNAAGGKPELMPPPTTPKEFYSFLQIVENRMNENAGLNYVTMGDPQNTRVLSGSAMALLESMTIRFVNNLQQNFTRFREDYALGLVNALQQFATEPRRLQIAGKNKAQYVKEWDASDIEGIDRVIVDIGNPLTQTLSGRLQLAQDMADKGMIKTPQQYVTVMETGNLDTLMEDQLSENMLIVDENEKLRNGVTPPVIMTDQHLQHLQGHRAVLASVDTRGVDHIVKAALDHQQQHISLYKSMDPDLMAIMGLQPLPSASMAPAGGGPGLPPGGPAEAGAGPGGAGPGGAGGPPAVPAGGEGPETLPRPNEPNMPKMPINPVTRERYNPGEENK